MRPDGAGVTRNGARWRPPYDRAHAHITPDYILDPVRSAMGGTIGLDVCTDPDNPTRAERFYSLPADGCSLPWDAPVWCNPPYGDAAGRWIRRALEVGATGLSVALLIPAATDTPRIQAVLSAAGRVVFLAGRIDFGSRRPDGKPARGMGGSLLALWNLPPIPELGCTMRAEAAGVGLWAAA